MKLDLKILFYWFIHPYIIYVHINHISNHAPFKSMKKGRGRTKKINKKQRDYT